MFNNPCKYIVYHSYSKPGHTNGMLKRYLHLLKWFFLDFVLLNIHYNFTKMNPDLVFLPISYFVTKAIGTCRRIPAPFQLDWVANCISAYRRKHYLGLGSVFILSSLPKLQSIAWKVINCYVGNQSLVCLQRTSPHFPLH